ncbi:MULTISPECIES: hypothetical protein [Catenuloplanes]|uniref:Uncharacterized protein n=1 Tax=Catenuloplanes niger TaxID=587534 RepID=A0AAE3ZP58_9ACTN|nr:hypothetical protein [Catenuloplanes niger]MDR7323509.1 hypothetical protein [Catenuloplanes niger]
MDRLAEIVFCLPASPAYRQFLDELRSLLAEVAYASSDAADSLVLTPPMPPSARPVTRVGLADVPEPEIVLNIGRRIPLAGRNAIPDRERMELADLARRLTGHVGRVDHTGVNLPTRSVPADEWHDLVRDLAAVAAMYHYPTGEPWPFILPATPGELTTDIRDFVVGREPRFELVHDEWSSHTTWQFALWTTLTRAELEELIPAPWGTGLPGLEDIFRTVYVRHACPNLEIRFDLCFRVDEGPSDWETGEWLVTEGGRIR